MELAHEIRLAEIAANENEKQRNFEWRKRQQEFEREKADMKRELEELKVPNEIDPNTIIPDDMKEQYKKYVKHYLRAEGTHLNQQWIQTFRERITSLYFQIQDFAEDQTLDLDEIDIYQNLFCIASNLDEIEKNIKNHGTSSNKTYKLCLEQEWSFELLDSLEE